MYQLITETVIGQLEVPLQFNKMLGKLDYINQLRRNYPKKKWLTPSQIFKPYYGYAIGTYILKAIQRMRQLNIKIQQIKIIQVGAGLGSLCNSILDFFKIYQGMTYNKISYLIFQLSESLCNKIENKLLKKHPLLIQNQRIKVFRQDILNHKFKKQENYFILFLEVLDNMPHDKVMYNANSNVSKFNKKFDLQTVVEIDFDQHGNQVQKRQSFQQITDQLIKEMVQLYSKHIQNKYQRNYRLLSVQHYYAFKKYIITKRAKGVFLPTYFLSVLKKLKQNIPNHNILIGDFDTLLSYKKKLNFINQPFVQGKGDNPQDFIDFQNYLVGRGEADIFFPTDFNFLKCIYQSVTGREGLWVKNSQFIRQFSSKNWCRTMNGYCPMQQQFINTSFFVNKI